MNLLIIALQKEFPVRRPLPGDHRSRRIGFYPVRVSHHVADTDQQATNQQNKSQEDTVSERNARGIGCNHGGKGVNGGTQHTNAGADQDDGDPGHGIVAGRKYHGYQNGVKRQGFLCHPVGGATDGEEHHQDRYHPDLMALQVPHRASDAGIDGPSRIHHTEKTAQKQDEHGNIDGIGDVAVGVVEPGCRCQHHINEALRVWFDGLVGSRHRHFPSDFFIHGALVLPGGNYPGQRGNKNNQAEKNGVSRGESRGEVVLEVFWQLFIFSHDASPFLNRIVQSHDADRSRPGTSRSRTHPQQPSATGPDLHENSIVQDSISGIEVAQFLTSHKKAPGGGVGSTRGINVTRQL